MSGIRIFALLLGTDYWLLPERISTVYCLLLTPTHNGPREDAFSIRLRTFEKTRGFCKVAIDTLIGHFEECVQDGHQTPPWPS
jgi:hypothetical protein